VEVGGCGGFAVWDDLSGSFTHMQGVVCVCPFVYLDSDDSDDADDADESRVWCANALGYWLICFLLALG